MKYISSKDAAQKWGVSQRWVSNLAKQGRIKGAKCIGSRYMIPDDALRPLDGRITSSLNDNKNNININPDNFRYFSFEHRNLSTFNPPLNDNELRLKACEEAFHACHFEDAERILGDLPETATDRYLRIFALYLGCLVDIMMMHVDRFYERYGKLLLEVHEDFPHKMELKELSYEIDGLLGDYQYFLTEFKVDPIYTYHDSFMPHLATLSMISLFYSYTVPSNVALNNAELNCQYVDRTEAYFDRQACHLYIGNTYVASQQSHLAAYHFEKALEIAQKYHLYYYVAIQYYYYHIGDFIKNTAPELLAKIKEYGEDIHNRFLQFSLKAQMNNIYTFLKKKDFIYLEYAMMGLSNKEVANRMHVSIGTIGKKYSDLYALCGVKNKKGLIELNNKKVL